MPTSKSSPLGLDLGQVEDPIATLLQGPRFDPDTHNGIRSLGSSTTRRVAENRMMYYNLLYEDAYDPH
jgi:hypothetical protein